MMHKIDNILLVDDDAITNFLNLDIISKMDVAHHVNVVEDGKEALEFIKENWLMLNKNGSRQTNLIFLDINMPNMGAFQFLERFELLHTENHISTVLLTAFDRARDLERARHFNVSGYLKKPLDSQKVYSVLQMV